VGVRLGPTVGAMNVGVSDGVVVGTLAVAVEASIAPAVRYTAVEMYPSGYAVGGTLLPGKTQATRRAGITMMSRILLNARGGEFVTAGLRLSHQGGL